MGDGPITFADGVVLTILLLSGVFAFVRGFTREVLTIAAVGLSAVILFLAYPPVQEWAREVILDGFIMDVVVASALFLIPLVALSFASHHACVQVRESGVGVADRVLGFGFGVVRGLAAVAIVYWMYSVIEDPDDHPRWIERAKLFPVVADSAEYIHQWFPNVAAVPLESRFAELVAPSHNEGDTEPVTGYVRSDRRAIERVVRITGDHDAG